ncbi:MAG TPA: penicillin-binding transpeptidase domain-containing protein [Candidatus Acidoferrum sp.]|nr:penicillin-binding transpeptidase domain-containing protein [Candidatus Acidoferrum sp.]
MLIFDELKKNDPQLRFLAMVLAGGLLLLLAGLWWVQVVMASKYESHLETQSYRTVRIPAARGKILDRNGRVLAQNRPRYSLSLYLDDLRLPFYLAYSNALKSARAEQRRQIADREKRLDRSLTKAELRQFALAPDQLKQLHDQSRFQVADRMVKAVGQWLGQPLSLNETQFNRHYETRLALPYPLVSDLNEAQIARFEEQYPGGLGVELDLQPARSYPYGTTAAHLLGYVLRDDSSKEGEDAYFNYYLPDYRGQVGVEAGFDAELRGRAGAAAVLVNNLGYRQTENVWSPPEPGHDVVLTIDLDIQQAAENALAAHQGPNARAAVIVMDVHTGDVLALVSSPEINPDYSANDPARLADPKLRPQINRATYENYMPGSIFKPIVALAALENGLNPDEIYQVQPDPAEPWHGCIYVGARKIKDTVPPGSYNLKRAIVQSSNAYFIFNGLRTGIEKIVRLGEKFHLGQRMNLPTRQESPGIFPTEKRIRSDWRDGDSANIFFGQGEVAVTPMQVAVVYSAIANGGKVLWPRLVERIEPQDPTTGELPTIFPSGVVRDTLGLRPRSYKILYEAMLAETEDPEGTGHAAPVPGLRVCGKTGTAQVKDEHGQLTRWNYWFASFAPYENPRYVVVVMVESENRGSGGIVCAPIAHDIYEAIVKSERADVPALAEQRRGVTAN